MGPGVRTADLDGRAEDAVGTARMAELVAEAAADSFGGSREAA